jgi:RiboL-PSP-HEPN
MSASIHFRELKKRVAELQKHLLPKVFSPTGDYKERVRDSARGFRVLAHAEVEYYLETIATHVIDKSISSWKTKKKTNYVLVAFLAAYHRGWMVDATDRPVFAPASGVKPSKTIIEAVDAANSQYKTEIIRKNNGIKIANLHAIFLPIGVDFDMLDQTWLSTVESYGKQRGEIAHQSKKAQQQIDPKGELDKISQVLVGLEELDQIVKKFAPS